MVLEVGPTVFLYTNVLFTAVGYTHAFENSEAIRESAALGRTTCQYCCIWKIYDIVMMVLHFWVVYTSMFDDADMAAR